MSCYKIDGDTVFVVCPCGEETVYSVNDLELSNHTVCIPMCVHCKRALFLHVSTLSGDELDLLSPETKKRNVLNHTLYQRLVDVGKKRRFAGTDPDTSRVSLAVADTVVEAPLHKMVKQARDVVLKQKNRPR